MRIIFLIIFGISISVNADFYRQDGVVKDSNTLLQWQDDYSDNYGYIKIATWTAAIEYCEDLDLDNGGWRLPNINELESIVDYSTYDPSINSIFVYIYPASFWSSTTDPIYSSLVRLIYFDSGDFGDADKFGSTHVRCVR